MKTIHTTASMPAWLRVLLLAVLTAGVACKENSGASSPGGGGSPPSSGGVSGGGMPSGSSGGGTTGRSGGAPGGAGMPSPGGGSSGDRGSRGGGAAGEVGGARGSSGSGAGMSSPSGGAGMEIPVPGGGSPDIGGAGNQSSGNQSGGDSGGAGDCGSAGGLPGGVGGMGQDGDCLGGAGGSAGEIPGESDAERAGRLGEILDESLGDFDRVLHEQQQEAAAVGRNTEGFGGGRSGGIGLGEQAAGSGGSVAVVNEAAVRPESPTASMSEDEIRERTPDDVPLAADDDIIARQLREAALAEEDAALRERLWDEYRKYKGL